MGSLCKLTLVKKLSQPLKKDDNEELTLASHKRLKVLRVLLFAFMVYDIINDISVYETMIAVVDNDVFQNPCMAPNQRGSFYPAHVAHLYTWNPVVTRGINLRYPETMLDIQNLRYVHTNFVDFSQYLFYTSEVFGDIIKGHTFSNIEGSVVNDGRSVIDGWSGSNHEDNVKMFASFCENFNEVDSIQECAYSNATIATSIPCVSGDKWFDGTPVAPGECLVNFVIRCVNKGPDGDCLVEAAEGCVRVRNVQQERNHHFKKFIVASIAVVCVKELFKALLILSIWLRAPSRKLHPIELGLVGESPFCLLLVWRRPNFLQELLLTSKTWASLLVVFFFEDVLESVNQIALVVYFALRVSQQGIEYGIMFSMAASVAKTLKTGYNGLTAWKKEKKNTSSAIVHVEGGDGIATDGASK